MVSRIWRKQRLGVWSSNRSTGWRRKMKLLVGMVDRMKEEQARAAEENERLTRELDAMRARLATSDSLASELSC